MAKKIQVKRGNAANLPTLAPGELGLTVDTKKLYVGHSQGNIQLATADQMPKIINTLTETVQGKALDATQGKTLNDTKQNKTDNSLQTSSKSVIGAINELSSLIVSGGSIIAGTYTGNGTSRGTGGDFDERLINLRAAPKAVLVVNANGEMHVIYGGSTTYLKGGLAVSGSPVRKTESSTPALEITPEGFQINNRGDNNTNENNTKYNYVAVL